VSGESLHGIMGAEGKQLRRVDLWFGISGIKQSAGPRSLVDVVDYTR
jgi:hypothetical protein